MTIFEILYLNGDSKQLYIIPIHCNEHVYDQILCALPLVHHNKKRELYRVFLNHRVLVNEQTNFEAYKNDLIQLECEDFNIDDTYILNTLLKFTFKYVLYKDQVKTPRIINFSCERNNVYKSFCDHLPRYDGFNYSIRILIGNEYMHIDKKFPWHELQNIVPSLLVTYKKTEEQKRKDYKKQIQIIAHIITSFIIYCIGSCIWILLLIFCFIFLVSSKTQQK